MPSLVEDDEDVVAMDSLSAGDGDMKIAWRYKDKPIVQVCRGIGES